MSWKKILSGILVISLLTFVSTPALGTTSEDHPWGIDRMDAEYVWDHGITGDNITVGVIDTGIDPDHPDLEGSLINLDDDENYTGGWIEYDEQANIISDSTPYDSDPDGHGTHISGTLTGSETGIAPDSSLMVSTFEPSDSFPIGSDDLDQFIACLNWMIEPTDSDGNLLNETHGGNISDYQPDVVSISLGFEGYVEELEGPIQDLRDAGIIPVVSAGNDGDDSITSPGAIYETISVGASDQNDDIADFSSGAIIDDEDHNRTDLDDYIYPDFSAPGVSVNSTIPDGSYEYKSGTSMSAPHVAGTIALMLDADPDLDFDDVYEILKDSVDHHEDAGSSLEDDQNTRYGHGIINTAEAVNNLIDADIIPIEDDTLLDTLYSLRLELLGLAGLFIVMYASTGDDRS